MTGSKKAGRPRKYEVPLHFGMKVTAEEKQKIRTLAHATGKTATRVIMELVDSALAGVPIPPVHLPVRRITADELLALPKAERDRILREHARQAAQDYEIIEDTEDIVE